LNPLLKNPSKKETFYSIKFIWKLQNIHLLAARTGFELHQKIIREAGKIIEKAANAST
jgi:hypothetical protein